MPNLTNTQKMYIKTVYIIFHISRGKAVFKMTGSSDAEDTVRWAL